MVYGRDAEFLAVQLEVEFTIVHHLSDKWSRERGPISQVRLFRPPVRYNWKAPYIERTARGAHSLIRFFAMHLDPPFSGDLPPR